MSRDALVIGGGINGLVAAGLLARAGLKTIVVEASDSVGGLASAGSRANGLSASLAHTVYALDPEVVSLLRLPRHGLRFAVRDMPLVALNHNGGPLALDRNVHVASRAIGRMCRPDAQTYPRFRHELFALGRALRPLWWHDAELSALDMFGIEHVQESIERLRRQSVLAMLDNWFESPALKAALAFDATSDGVAADETPSALTLLWRASQEIGGLQGAVAQPTGGTSSLADAVTNAAKTAGAEVRTDAAVSRIVLKAGSVAGVTLATGEEIEASLILSSLSRRRTAQLLPTAETGLAAATRQRQAGNVGEAHIAVALDGAPNFGPGIKGGRFVVAERGEALSAAHRAAETRQLPEDLTYEAVVTAPVPDQPAAPYTMSVLVRPVPVALDGGWDDGRVLLAAKVVASLNGFDRSIKNRIRHIRISVPQDATRRSGSDADRMPTVDRLLSPARARISSPLTGLFFCGAEAEPVDAISGRAARHAVRAAMGSRRLNGWGRTP